MAKPSTGAMQAAQRIIEQWAPGMDDRLQIGGIDGVAAIIDGEMAQERAELRATIAELREALVGWLVAYDTVGLELGAAVQGVRATLARTAPKEGK